MDENEEPNLGLIGCLGGGYASVSDPKPEKTGETRTKLILVVEGFGPKPKDCFHQEDFIVQALNETDEEFMERGAVVLEVMRHRAGHG